MAYHPSMAADLVNHNATYEIGDFVYVLITLPDRRLAGWTKGEVVSEEIWKYTIASNGEPCPRRFYVVKYGQNSAECHSSPSHGNILPCTDLSKHLIRQSGGQWLDPIDL